MRFAESELCRVTCSCTLVGRSMASEPLPHKNPATASIYLFLCSQKGVWLYCSNLIWLPESVCYTLLSRSLERRRVDR
ncbi:hypothetical protein BD309DRAFT_955572 [Dichomitus squalens]|uniref:Uncharacterized protein n=1 Tax=Dichomitus squalens TaxID=114155 RepID=A0A4Q9MZ06_9APHY|nr:hypothetical protein BD311DRAFT_748485 [Dichomitus squalens]TBU45700.1 hypothetical protein BD309DRAFT_955572 [Dichomitus squalens]TBU62781.1 hypothetical protein BD310DRAFT_918163 [Dichomitus squalens]